MSAKKWRKWQHEVRRVAEVLGAPFIGWEMKWSGRESGSQAAAGGAPITHWLLEEEATTHRFHYLCLTEGGTRRHNARRHDRRTVTRHGAGARGR
jgi:hypothetical protein